MTADVGAATPPGFLGIVEALNRHDVRYVVIGGVAAILQGAPLTRTLDLDVTPAPDRENKRRLAQALADLDARLRAPGLDERLEIPLDERTFTGMTTMTFMTRLGPFDVCFLPDGTDGYDDLARDARTVEFEGVSTPVASLDDIVRSKMAARREKDAAHLVILAEEIRRRRGERA
ncbi:MAG TPA: hypothetical protein VG318_07450 [Actinomycetota bacterium]|nr:hypothetical protein [Actinomycetota bacterium]